MMTKGRFVHYTLGHLELDQQHWELFMILESIIVELRRQDYPAADLLIDDAIEFLAEHHKLEDDIMTAGNYPYTKWHGNDKNMETMLQLKSHLGRDHLHYFDIAAFEDIFLNHVDHDDRKFIEWITTHCTN